MVESSVWLDGQPPCQVSHCTSRPWPETEMRATKNFSNSQGLHFSIWIIKKWLVILKTHTKNLLVEWDSITSTFWQSTNVPLELFKRVLKQCFTSASKLTTVKSMSLNCVFPLTVASGPNYWAVTAYILRIQPITPFNRKTQEAVIIRTVSHLD